MQKFTYDLTKSKSPVVSEMTPEDLEKSPVPEAVQLAEDNPGEIIVGWRVDRGGVIEHVDVDLLRNCERG